MIEPSGLEIVSRSIKLLHGFGDLSGGRFFQNRLVGQRSLYEGDGFRLHQGDSVWQFEQEVAALAGGSLPQLRLAEERYPALEALQTRPIYASNPSPISESN